MKNKKLRILIIIVFIFALILSMFAMFSEKSRVAITPPSQITDTIDWPEMNDDKIKYSIIDYDGSYDYVKFKKLFKEDLDQKFDDWITTAMNKTFEYHLIYGYKLPQKENIINVEVKFLSDNISFKNETNKYTMQLIDNYT